VPYHSDALSQIAAELVAEAAAYGYKDSETLLLSSQSDLSLGPRYWGAHLCGPIDFTRVGATVGALHQATPCTVVDLGADGALSRSVRRAAADDDVRAVRLFGSTTDPRESYLRGLASLWVQGHQVDLGVGAGRFVSLPPRAFDRRRHLKESSAGGRGSKPTQRAIRREPSLENWIYYPSWRLRRPPAQEGIAGERWLVLAAEDTPVTTALRADGIDCVHVRPGDLRAGDEESVKAMVAGLGLGDRPISRLVHLWCLDDLPDSGTLDGRLASMRTELAKGFYTLLYAIQEISLRQGAKPLQLDIVTRGIHPLRGVGEAVIPERSLMTGPALVVPQDLPFVSARTVDVTGLAEPEIADEILAELRCRPVDRAVTFGGGARWARSYEPGTLPSLDSGERPLRLRERGVYLITGGLGGIGMTLAEYLVRTCRARLVLTALEAVPDPGYWEGGRTDLPGDELLAERVVRLRKLVELGGEVLATRCDAASPTETRALFDEIDRRWGRLDGVVHAAGVFETQRAFRGLEDTGAEDCTRRLRPKVDGTIVLAECLRGRRLDFVLMQSSLSAQLGGLGFYAYTAGNAYMDAFAERQRDDEIPWMSVNWDGWIFRERDDDTRHQAVVAPSFASPDFGVVAEIAVRPSEGAEIYGRLMNLARPEQVLVSTADFTARYRQWVEQPLPSDGEFRRGDEEPVRGHFSDDVEAAVAAVWREVLGVEELDRTSNFFALGGDSLLGVTLAFRLGQVFDVVLSVITMFDRPTLSAMAEEIRRLGARPTQTLGEPA
jgi:NAD(P)-dependent dehydrogenase (short-subunit alcohol dehydrogenase family)